MKRKTIIKTAHFKRNSSGFLRAAVTAAFCLLFFFIVPLTNAQEQTPAPQKPRLFGTVEEAAEALIAAVEKFDEASLWEILGPGSNDIIYTGEPIRDREVAAEFAALARKKMSVTLDPKNRRRVFIEIGYEHWAFPVPLVKLGTKWHFDVKAGRQEVLLRRIGRNELEAIQICRGYVEAQHSYALTKHDDSIVNQYAQRIISSPGKQDGLAWQKADGTWGGTVSERAARAIEKSYMGMSAPFHGYYFKILKGQGPAAPLGKMDFVVDGVMIGGFALIAYPSLYRYTGVKTFMVSHDGVVYEKDLGPNTHKIAQGIELFNPDKSWNPILEPVEPATPANVGANNQ